MFLILWFRYLFFSDWDTLNGEPGLERAYMDGTNRYGIIRSKLGWPAGITLDIDAKRVYWVDSRYDYLETTTYDGLHRYAKRKKKKGFSCSHISHAIIGMNAIKSVCSDEEL